MTGTPPDPTDTVATRRTPDSAPWAADDELGQRLRAAVQTLLDHLPLVMDDLERNFSDTLVGGGEIVCDMAGLHPSWGPLIESDVLRLVTDAAGLRAASAFSRSMPLMIAAIDAQPLDVQRTLIERAAERLLVDDSKVPNPRFIAAVSKSPHWNARTLPATPGLTAGSRHAPPSAGQFRRRSP